MGRADLSHLIQVNILSQWLISKEGDRTTFNCFFSPASAVRARSQPLPPKAPDSVQFAVGAQRSWIGTGRNGCWRRRASKESRRARSTILPPFCVLVKVWTSPRLGAACRPMCGRQGAICRTQGLQYRSRGTGFGTVLRDWPTVRSRLCPPLTTRRRRHYYHCGVSATPPPQTHI